MNRYNRRTVEIVSAVETGIIDLDDVKAFLRIDGTDDDVLLAMFVTAALEAAEKYTRRAIRVLTLDATMDGFPFDDDEALVRLGAGVHNVPLSYITGRYSEFDLPYPPVTSITTITTYNRANAGSVFDAASYLLDGSRVVLNDGYTWPTGLRDYAAVKVRYVAGYGSNTPSQIKLAIMQHIAAMYECRSGCDIPEHAQGMLNAYRLADGLSW